MEDTNYLLLQLRWDTPAEALIHAKSQLKLLRDEDLTKLVQPLLDKGLWDNAAELLVEIGYPRVKHIIYELLSWIQDMNWPGARVVSDFLVEIGEPLILHIKNAFMTRDSTWKYWIITQILSRWDRKLLMHLIVEMRELASSYDTEGVHIEALGLLARKRMLDSPILYECLISQKANKLNVEYMDDLVEIEELIGG